MAGKRISGITVGLFICLHLAGAEIRVVRFQTIGAFSPPPCSNSVSWASQTFFQNTTEVIQTVRFLGVSNGDSRPNPRSLSIPPRQAVSIEGESRLDWEPGIPGAQPNGLWVNRLDVPEGVLVANRVQSFLFEPDHPEPPCTGTTTRYAGLPLPVFSTLAPAGVSQYFLGVDVGSAGGTGPYLQITDSRLNIGVYNGGSATATASVKIYCGALGADPGFGNSLLATTSIQVPANAVVQRTVLASTQTAQCFTAGNSFWYATVTADQPSFAYAIGLSNQAPPKFPGTVALTYTGN